MRRIESLPPSWPIVTVIVLSVVVMGCARVRPWQRERLASPAMTWPQAESPIAGGHRAKLLESRTGGGVPGVAAGGGCGCTQ